MQHLVVKGLGRRAVAEALAGGIVVQLDDLRKGRFGEVNQPGLAGERAPQAADGVLPAPLLPGGAGIAEESLDTQGMEAVVAGELGAIVEGDGLASLRGEGGQQAGDGVGGDIGMLAGEAGEEDQAGVALSEGQEGGAVVAGVHQVPLPMAKGGAVGGGMGALAERDPVGDVGGRAAAAPAPKAALGLGRSRSGPSRSSREPRQRRAWACWFA